MTQEQYPEDVGERFIDELKYFDLGFDRAFHHRLVFVNDPRTIANLLTACGSQEEFVFKVAALADIFNNLDLSGLDTQIDPAIQGRLNRLGAFLQSKGILTFDQPLQVLRAVIKIRNSFPVHSGDTAFLSACHDLSVAYPPTDWNSAWVTVIGSAWKALRNLRLMLPS